MRRRRALLLIGITGALLIGVWIPRFRPQPSPGYIPVNLRSLTMFDFDPAAGTVADIPPQLRRLDGQKVRLEGWACNPHPTDGRTISFQFLDLGYPHHDEHRPPYLQERVFAQAPTDRIPPGFASWDDAIVYGTLHVSVTRDGTTGEAVQVYSMDVDRLEPATPPAGVPAPEAWLHWAYAAAAAACMAISATGALLRLRQRRSARLRAAGMICCLACGYDMRVTPWRCPECGHVAADSAAVGG